MRKKGKKTGGMAYLVYTSEQPRKSGRAKSLQIPIKSECHNIVLPTDTAKPAQV